MRYRFGAVEVRSSVALPGYARYQERGAGAWQVITVDRAREPAPPATPLWHHHGPRGLLRVGRTTDGHLLVTAEGLATCAIGPDRTVTWHVDGTPHADDADFLIGTIVAWVLARQPGLAVLHAATVTGPAGAVLVCGPSGAGKSTLSTAVHHRLGWRLFGDDAAVMSVGDAGPVVYSCSREVRLWTRSSALLGLPPGVPLPRYGDKGRHRIGGGARRPVPVVAVVLLVTPAAVTDPLSTAVTTTATACRTPGVERVRAYRPDETVALTRLTAGESIVVLRNNLVRPAPNTLEEARDEFGFLVRWGAGVPVWALRYPRTEEALSGAIQLVASTAAPVAISTAGAPAGG